MSSNPRFRASIHEIITDALAASEEELSAMRSEVLFELDQLRREATEEARERVRTGEAVAEEMLRSAERASADLAVSVAEAVEAARQQVDLFDKQLRDFEAASASLRQELSRSRDRLDEVDAGLRHISRPSESEGTSEDDEAPIFSEATAPPNEAPVVRERAPEPGQGRAATPGPDQRQRVAGGDQDMVGEATFAPTNPPMFKTQRRLAFGASETRLAATALTNSAVDKLDLVEELLASPNFSAEERSLSLMVLLREAEQLSRMAAQFGRPPLELTERLLELRRRTTRLLHGDEPEG